MPGTAVGCDCGGRFLLPPGGGPSSRNSETRNGPGGMVRDTYPGELVSNVKVRVTEVPSATDPKFSWSGICCGVLGSLAELEGNPADGAAGADAVPGIAGLGAGRSPCFCGGVGAGTALAFPEAAGAVAAREYTRKLSRIFPASVFTSHLLQKRPSIFSASGRSVSIETMSCCAGTRTVIVAMPVGFFTAMHWVL